MLKFEALANVGDVIKAYDFKPMPEEMKADYPDRFLVGRVIEKGDVKHPRHNVVIYRGYTVEILVGRDGYIKGETAFVPFEVSMGEYDERVECLITAEEIEILAEAA